MAFSFIRKWIFNMKKWVDKTEKGFSNIKKSCLIRKLIFTAFFD